MVKVINKIKELLGIEYTAFAIYAIGMTLLFLYGVVNVIIAMVQGHANYVPFGLLGGQYEETIINSFNSNQLP